MEIILLTGVSGVGKSTIAERLSESFDIFLIKERDILHYIAQGLGFEKSRFCLQAIGLPEYLRLAREETLRSICQTDHGPKIIIDGAYDRQIKHYLNLHCLETNINVLAILASRHIRRRRLIGRSFLPPRQALQEAIFFDSIKYQAGIQEVIQSADFKIRSEGSIDQTAITVSKILGLI